MKRCLFVLWLALLTTGSLPAQDSDSLRLLLAGRGFGGAKLERRFPNHLVVAATINGKHAGLLVDTGAPFTLIDRNSVQTLGLTVKKTGMQVGGVWGASVERFGMSQIASLSMGNLSLTNIPVAISDQNAMNHFGGLRHMDGLFGASEMRKFGAVIDCARQMIYLRPAGSSAAISQQVASFLVGRGFTRVPMRVNANHHFEVDAAVNGHATSLIVDTGAGTTLLEKERAIQYGIMPTSLRMGSEAPNGKFEHLDSGIAKTLTVGAFQIANADVTLGDVSSAILARGADLGLLGQENLSWNFAVIDLAGLSLYLRHADKR